MILKTATREGLDAAPEVNPKQGWPGLKGEKSVRSPSRSALLTGRTPLAMACSRELPRARRCICARAKSP